MKAIRILFTLLLTSISLCHIYALVPSDRRQRLTNGWEFIRQDMGSIWEVMRPVPGAGKPEAVPLWTAVTLPHCFNAEDAVEPDVNYYQGAGWYRTSLPIDNPYSGGRVYLEFEGAGQKTDVYVYTTLVASHTGGYDEWKADITEAVTQFRSDAVLMKRFKGQIPIAIRCDNSRDTEMLPSDMSDFNLYGGLYRYVNLIYVPDIHIENIGIDARTDEQGKEGDISLDIRFNGLERIPVSLSVHIFAPDGKEIYATDGQLQNFPATTRTPMPYEPPASDGKNSTCLHIADVRLKRPVLWSPSTPALYTCLLELTCGTDTLRTTERFAFRHFRFEEKGPFYLNGHRLLLRGTHRHEDHAGVGAALTEEMMRTEMQQIKEMGANFIRLGHYQQSSIILRLCDELGILVWEEIPWCRGGLGSEVYKAQARRMLTNMIHQHRNHPSVILWGMGNENDWPGDFETFSQDSIRAFMKELHDLSHRIDPSRCTVIRRCDFCKDIVDIYSPTIWAGWYGRRFRDYAAMEKAGFDATPRFIHAEWGGDSHAGRHTENGAAGKGQGYAPLDSIEAADRNGDWSESYIIRLFDWHLKEQEQMPWLTGSAFWTFKDFSTPLRPENPIPYVNQKGVVQRDGTPKESYYVFQSYWAKTPMLHIYGHTWPVRWGKPGEAKEILVYSNCPEVELFVNGKSVGKKKRDSRNFPAAGLHWNAVLQEGDNLIEAVGYNGKLRLNDKIRQEYQTHPWGMPAQLHLSVSPDASGSHFLVQAEVLDRDGVRCLDAKDVIEFGCTDLHALLQNQGTAQGSRRIQAANGRACICVKKSSAPVIVSACDKGKVLKTAFITLNGQ
ncbi:glycoside hydrolase family 2 TIM barrel-domain containing protein [Bacteroides helcogenes]|uniref:Glycoside hydrolase family 2 TIM barrel n=1 Tax=Bacteroides helcogenes (strain ATCC 35417 / DSM 20613 / JCM 6297 / CCUG 15421 / P 36-108) TaxID=693979 RepID=E6SWN0_BACT6|nr:glycoside hydrolase family 2 TIM barrel-domain containing protein [Bacteroides helcogenes]ADV42628.1 glycoside hydrolase family 2 TIM barrel [Bacteroides helcogenes P 36-108]MDY5239459.1 glycoside hydrolase family 2 TIM barrel-domain containing protein [Bacteroides helcogenes]